MSALTWVRNSSPEVLDAPPSVEPQLVQYTFPTKQRIFYQVGGVDHPERMDVITEIFHRILTPLYGSQEKALHQIRESTDRRCFLLYEGEDPVGVTVFKTLLSNEFAQYGVTDSVEIKSLFVDQSVKNSGRGLGSILVDKVKEEVDKLALGHQGIHVTVSETKQESLLFFKKKGFEIVHEWKGRYMQGVVEYLLSCPARIQAEVQSTRESLERHPGLSLSRQIDRVVDPLTPELIHIIHNAHGDDIHALKKLADGTFISGSKDHCLYKWSPQGALVRTVNEVQPDYRTERDWITAVEVLNDRYWLSGERSGKAVLWTTNGDYVREIKSKLPSVGHVSHQCNARRINCIAKGLSPDKPSFFVGFPTMFDEFNFIENRTETSTKVHVNDWVYCIHPIDEQTLFTVTGCNVDQWNRSAMNWCHGGTLVPEGKRYLAQVGEKKKWQRPFISSLVPLESHRNHFGLSFFDGSVKILDVTTKIFTREWKEHIGRIWHIENIAPELFASSGEDRSIKLWDTRSPSSVRTLPGHIGQVTALLHLSEHVLIAGTCPEDALASNKGAEIRFYEFRK